MKVFLRAFGTLVNNIGKDRHSLDLPERATLQDLMDLIYHQWHKKLPKVFWNPDKKLLSSSVIIMVDNCRVKTLDNQLRENQEVYLIQVMVGG